MSKLIILLFIIDMDKNYQEDLTFVRLPKLELGAYDHCIFEHCDFAEQDLSGIVFVDCYFKGCNLSLTNLNMSTFRDVYMEDCKVVGVHFDRCDTFNFSLTLKGCNLSHSSFLQMKLKGMVFQHCSLVEVDFSESDLRMALFDDCNLQGATFEQTNLEKADLRAAYNFTIDPRENRLKKTKFDRQNLAGLLQVFDISVT